MLFNTVHFPAQVTDSIHYVSEAKEASGAHSGHNLFSMPGPNNIIPYTEEKQPYLDVQIVQTNKLGESGDMFLQEIFENQTQSESDLMQNSIVLFVYMICSLSCPIN